MARVVVTKTCTIPSTGPGEPPVTLVKGQVVEVTTAQATAIGAAGGTTRTVATATQHDLLGEAFGVSNSS